MNHREFFLPELELATGQVRDALKALLHTILFIRSPGPISCIDCDCESFKLSYSRIASDKFRNQSDSKKKLGNPEKKDYLDKKVDGSIEEFLQRLTTIGPELLSGSLTLSFFERRASKQLFGMLSHEEKVVFEQWHIHIVVNNTPSPISEDNSAKLERQRIQDTAEAMVKSTMMKIFQYASGVDDSADPMSPGNLDHIPPTMYEFEIRTSKNVDDRENLVSQFKNMPALLNLES